MTLVSDILGQDGPFSKHIRDFSPRTQQQEMAEAVTAAIDEEGILIAEAGTGTGKTFSYLVPALMSGKKIIVSTGTKNLQDQLFYRDLPLVRKALGVPSRVALLKGRGNYLCLHRLDLCEKDARFNTRKNLAEYHLIRQWAGTTSTGDIASLLEVPEESPVWPQVTSTIDNCLGKDCPSFSDCYVFKARRLAQEADLLVVNHYLYFADMALRDDGFGELLPGANGVIFDEAHQLPEVASTFFGKSLSSGQFIELASDIITEQLNEAPDMPDLRREAERLQKCVSDLRLTLGPAGQRFPWQELAKKRAFLEVLPSLSDGLDDLHKLLELASARGKGLERCYERCIALQEKLQLLTGDTPENHIHWLEVHKRNFSIYVTPLDIADIFSEYLHRSRCAWVFTSATLAVQDNFDHFTHALGLEHATCHLWQSPFNYERQTLFYQPTGLPQPSDGNYNHAVIEQILPVIEASRGRVFLLVTSHKALREFAQLLEKQVNYPLLIQGDMPRALLLARFAELGNAILIGTSSFWEGVDVRGDALSCVIIDRLPFASPGDPVLGARIDNIRKQGGNPFRDYQLPQAVIELKQGVGRLIRDVNDSGVLVICDPRIKGRSYGRIFLNSLPKMPSTTNIKDVEQFFEKDARCV